MPFEKARKSQSKLRMCLYGTAGSGKSYTALSISRGLGGKIAAIDSENNSLCKYSHLVDFDVQCLSGDFNPQKYIDAIREAEKEGYETVIIDSLSHAWSGAGGALEMVSEATERSKSKNSYVAWRGVGPLQNKLIDALVQCKMHVIFTLRSKPHYESEKDDKGRLSVRRLGLSPVQREGFEYESDIVGEMDSGNLLVIKSRYSPLQDRLIKRPGEELGIELRHWLSDGEPVVSNPVKEILATRDEVVITSSLPEMNPGELILELERSASTGRIDEIAREVQRRGDESLGKAKEQLRIAYIHAARRISNGKSSEVE